MRDRARVETRCQGSITLFCFRDSFALFGHFFWCLCHFFVTFLWRRPCQMGRLRPFLAKFPSVIAFSAKLTLKHVFWVFNFPWEFASSPCPFLFSLFPVFWPSSPANSSKFSLEMTDLERASAFLPNSFCRNPFAAGWTWFKFRGEIEIYQMARLSFLGGLDQGGWELLPVSGCEIGRDNVVQISSGDRNLPLPPVTPCRSLLTSWETDFLPLLVLSRSGCSTGKWLPILIMNFLENTREIPEMITNTGAKSWWHFSALQFCTGHFSGSD